MQIKIYIYIYVYPFIFIYSHIYYTRKEILRVSLSLARTSRYSYLSLTHHAFGHLSFLSHVTTHIANPSNLLPLSVFLSSVSSSSSPPLLLLASVLLLCNARSRSVPW